MAWIKLSLGAFRLGYDAGPPPVRSIGWLRVSWWSAEYGALVEKMQRALVAARDELRR